MVNFSPVLFLTCLSTLFYIGDAHYGKQYYKEKDFRTKSWEKQKYNKYKKQYKKFSPSEPVKPINQNAHKKTENYKKIVPLPNIVKPEPVKPKKIQKPVKIVKKVEKQVKPLVKNVSEAERKVKQEVTVIQEPKQQQIKNTNTDVQAKVEQTIVVSPPQTPETKQTPNPAQLVPALDCSDKAIYDYNLLVLTWVPEECYADIDCEKDWQTYDDLRSPTIHAFRPYGSSSYYQNCFGETGDSNCRNEAYLPNFEIDEALWNVTGLLYEINQYWPALKFTHDQQSFYTHQWVMHGSCYLMNMIEDNQNAYKNDKAAFNRTIMIQYFRTAINKFKKLAIDVQPGKEYSQKEQFALDIGFKGKETHFALICNNKNQIVQIIFCFNRSKLPGKEVTIPCTLEDTCDETKIFNLKKPF